MERAEVLLHQDEAKEGVFLLFYYTIVAIVFYSEEGQIVQPESE